MKIKALVIYLVTCQLNLEAQELSLGFDMGYSNHLSPQSEVEYDRFGLYEADLETIVYSYGKGVNLNSNLEYFPKDKFVGFGIGIGYIKSATVSYISKPLLSETNFLDSWASLYRFTPYIKFKIKKEKVQYFSKIGYVLGGFGNLTSDKRTVRDNYERLDRRVYSGGVAHGVVTGFGINYNLTNRFSISTELQIITQSYAPTKSELVVSSVNGQNRLQSLPLADIQTEYVKSIFRNFNPSEANRDIPYVRPKVYFPFSGVSLSVGLRYMLIQRGDMRVD